jgi:hypothetical protein
MFCIRFFFDANIIQYNFLSSLSARLLKQKQLESAANRRLKTLSFTSEASTDTDIESVLLKRFSIVVLFSIFFFEIK